MNEQDGPIAEEAITELDPQTVDRIAAGEVVERPASVVKELVENSLDADANRISVTIESAGSSLIRVTDDGVGMTQAAVTKAIDRHTTSKLSTVADLKAGITTLGFRGEALHTIAAVSRVTIQTRPRNNSGAGTRVSIEGGELTDISPTGCPPGTTIAVEDLFYNTPARKSFLREPATEFDHISRMVSNYALANPSVALSLQHNGRELFAAPGRGDLRGTVGAVYGHEVATTMIDISETSTDGPLTSITGVVSDPETTRSRPRYLSTFVNGRYVTSGDLRDGVLDAYGGQLSADRYPFAVIHCVITPEDIDVNVHPRKLEVRFESADAVKNQLTRTIRDALISEGLIRSTAPRGRGAPEETVLPQERGEDQSPISTYRGTNSQNASTSFTASGTAPRSNQVSPSSPFQGPLSQQTVDGSSGEPTFEHLPYLDILGQLDETFIVAQSSDGLVLIDQHAADERIHYEKIRTQFNESTDRQTLVSPVSITVTPDEAAAFETISAALHAVGFGATVADSTTIVVDSVPAVIDTTVTPEHLRDAIGSAIESASAAGAIDEAADAIIGDLACYPAVTGHTALTEGSMVMLLEQLDACDNPYACPHGRPVLIRIDYDELRDRFERDYPGHADRRKERDK